MRRRDFCAVLGSAIIGCSVSDAGSRNPASRRSGAFSLSSAPDLVDTPPTAYRATTQTVNPPANNRIIGFAPPFAAEWSINIWGRIPPGLVDGYLFNLALPTGTKLSEQVGGGSGTQQGIALYWSGTYSVILSQNNRLATAGVDKAGNKFNKVLSGLRQPDHDGYGFTSGVLDQVGYAALYTVQYRSGNIEVWVTYKGMRPYLFNQRAVRWTGTDRVMYFSAGTPVTAVNSSAIAGPEVEMPVIFNDRSLSEADIIQLADGIHPELLGDVTNSSASAGIRFCALTNGGSTASDVGSAVAPTDGQTVTLNGSVYTFRNEPTRANDVQCFASLTGATYTASTNTFTKTAHGITKGRRLSFYAGGWALSATVSTSYAYYVVNAAADTFQLSESLDGTPVVISPNSASSITIWGTTLSLDALITKLNALTPNTGGASNASYDIGFGDILLITHRTAGATGKNFTFDTTCTAFMPANKRLALAWVSYTDQNSYRDPLLGNPMMYRVRRTAWRMASGVELAPNAPIYSVRPNSWSSGMVNQHVKGIANLLWNGTYTGLPPSGVDMKLYDQTTGTMLQDWRALTSFTIDTGAKTWSGKITAPKGKRWLAIETRKLGSTMVSQRSEVPWGVGEVVLVQGDSMAGMFMDSYGNYPLSKDLAGNPFVAPNGFHSRLGSNWTINALKYMACGGSTFANKVSNESDAVVGMTMHAVGGSSMSVFTTQANADHLNALFKANTITDDSMQGRIGWHLWDQGNADKGSDYVAKLDGLYGWLRANFGSDIKQGIAGHPNRRGENPDHTMGIHGLRRDQYIWMKQRASDPLVVDLGDDAWWSNYEDGAHPKHVSDELVHGEIWALSVLKHLNSASYSGVGPIITSATRNGRIVDVKMRHNGGTALQVPYAGDPTGFDVVLASNMNFAPTYIDGNVAVDPVGDTIGWIGHRAQNGDIVLIRAYTKAPGGLGRDSYYVVNRNVNNFQLATTPDGTPVDITSAGSGVVVICTNGLLPIASIAIINADTVRITLVSDPGGPVAVHYLWGQWGRKGSDPWPSADPTGRSAMSRANAQDNILCDNFPLAWANQYLVGKPVRPTSDAPVVTPT